MVSDTDDKHKSNIHTVDVVDNRPQTRGEGRAPTRNSNNLRLRKEKTE